MKTSILSCLRKQTRLVKAAVFLISWSQIHAQANALYIRSNTDAAPAPPQTARIITTPGADIFWKQSATHRPSDATAEGDTAGTHAPGIHSTATRKLPPAQEGGRRAVAQGTLDGTRAFPADIREGVIGSDSGHPVDQVFDNVFNIEVPQGAASREYTLHYEIYGTGAATRTVNDLPAAPAPGRHTADRWVQLSERVDAGTIRAGINTVVFTVPTNAGYTYRVRNVVLSEGAYRGAASHEHAAQVLKSSSKTMAAGTSGDVSLNGATLAIGQGALKQAATISATALRDIDMPAMSPEMVNVTAGDAGYRFLPHGELFQSPARLSIAYDKSKIPAGYTEQDVRTFYFDNIQKKWTVLEKDSLDVHNGRLASRTSHFTDFVNGVLKVPESPETGSYAPNSIKDIKAADPSEGIVAIAPPSPNNTGGVSTSFPIKLPAGRNGVQPSLAVTYSSEGGNGWMGLGWDLSIPSISIDTRWGVPTYDPAVESEIYSIAGEQLTFREGSSYVLPNRKEGFQKPRTPERQFYPRIEGAYNKIIRHGSSPSSYWWEVISKDGTRSYFGGDGTSVVENAVLRQDPGGNIGHWALYKTIDANGNFMLYSYDNGIYSGSPGNGAKEIYPAEIRYTLHAASPTPSAYSVKFITQAGRPDIQLNARLGFLEATSKRLSEIRVYFDTGIVRSYAFQYKEGAFKKTLLDAITEKDAAGNSFYTNRMEYEKAPEKLFSDPKSWTMPTQASYSDLSSQGDLKQGYSVLGGSRAKSIGGSFAAGIGLYSLTSTPPQDTSLFSFRKGTFGAHGSYSNASSENIVAFLDINGDNLPDRVYKSADGLSYSRNLSAPGGPEAFAPSAKLAGNISALGKSKTNTWGTGVNGNFSNVTMGFDYSNSTSTTTDYFMDFNSDGLVDYVSNGKVYFNRISTNGTPSFYDDSAGTPYPIYVSSAPANSGQSLFDDEDRKEKKTMLEQNPLHDIVRVWVAPAAGQIKVSNSFRLLNSPCPEGEDCSGSDGVAVSFQYRDQNPIVQNIAAEDFSQYSFPDQAINIQKGEKLYFRVSSKYDGTLDNVEWDPSIEYMPAQNPGVDSSNRSLSIYKASQDFVNSADTEFTAGNDGQLEIILDKPIPLSDNSSVTVRINSNDQVISIPAGQVFNGAVLPGSSINVSKNDKISISVHTDSQIDWTKFKVTPTFTDTATGQKQNLEVKYSMYNDKGTAAMYNPHPSDVGTQISLKAENLPIFNNYRGRIVVTAKRPNELLAKTVYNVNNNAAAIISQTTYTVTNNDLSAGPVYLETTIEGIDQNFNALFDASPIQVTVSSSRLNYIDFPGQLSYELPNASQTSHMDGQITIGQPATLYFALSNYAPMTYALLSLSKIVNGTQQPVGYPNGTLSGHTGLPTYTSGTLEPGTYAYNINFSKGDSPNASVKMFLTDPGSESVLFSDSAIKPDKSISAIKDPATALASDKYDARLGLLYRGWGGFALNGNNKARSSITDGPDPGANYSNAGSPGEMKVEELQLRMSQAYSQDPGTNPAYSDPNVNPDGSVDLPSNGAAMAENYFSMLASSIKNPEKGRWKDADEAIYISGPRLSASRIGVHSIDNIFSNNATTQSVGTTSLGAPSIKLKNQSVSIAGGASSGVLGLNASKTLFSEAKSIRNVLDYNGDGFPDDFMKTNIKLTHAVGFLSDRQQSVGSQSISKANAGGFSAGFSFTHGSSERIAYFSVGGTKEAQAYKNSLINKASKDSGKGSTQLSVNGSVETNEESSKQTFLDINGDGLPDKFRSGRFEINTGGGFSNSEDWGAPYASEGSGTGLGVGAGVSLFYGSFDFGLNFSSNSNSTDRDLADINGDGLPDKVEYSGDKATVTFNTGSTMDASTNHTYQFFTPKNVQEDTSVTYGGNVAGTILIPIPFPSATQGLKLTLTAGASLASTTTKSKSGFRDVNGDGYLDFVTSDDANNLTVQLNQTGTTNLLKKVTMPMGGYWEVEYARTGNTYELPQSRYIMTSVTVNDGFNKDAAFKPDTKKTRISYKNPYYSRRERTFYGFQDVNIYQLDTDGSIYRKVEQSFLNRNYYLKGVMVAETLKDASFSVWTEKKSTYQLRYIHDPNTANHNLDQTLELEKNHTDYACFLALTKTESKFYEGQATPGKTTSSSIIKYDSYGNVVQAEDLGDTNIGASEVLASTATYKTADSGSTYYSLPVAVKSTAQNVVRERKAVYNEAGNPPTLDLVEMQVLNGATPSVYNFEYDVYGNITKSTGPANYKGERFFHKYTYDSQVRTFPTLVEDAFGYTSKSRYDFKFGAPLFTEDMNLQPMQYKYDTFGRTAEIAGPYEMFNDIPWTIRFSYMPVTDAPLNATAAESYAKTEHYDPEYQGSYITTITIADGLGTPIQVKKSASIYNAASKKDDEKYIVSGKVVEDAFGRALSTYYPTTEDISASSVRYNAAVDTVAPTVNTYDVMDRVTSTTLPGEQLSSSAAYDFGADRLGRNMFHTTFRDELGTVKETFTDIKGRTTTVKEPSNTGEITTSFTHDALGNILEVKDVNGNLTQSAYDGLGRRTSYRHPDSGTSTFAYDAAGNMTSKTNAAAETVGYEYDYTRLKAVNYPKFPENNVKYYYGKAKDASAMDNNAVGRLWYQTDATGTQYLKYGRLGELTYQRRSVAVQGRGVFWFGTEWEYDTWNRVKNITYPDGEKVTYSYNRGGDLKSMASKKDSYSQSIINNLGYDKFEQRVYLEYGNRTKTTYEYENDRRRLLKLNAQTAASRPFQQNLYQYDVVSNVLQIHNNAPFAPAGMLGGGTNYAYGYDDLYRLTSASGNWRGKNAAGTEERQRYTVSMAYDNMHNVTRKEQKHERAAGATGNDWTNMEPTSYRLNYSYKDAAHPHAPSTIIDEPNKPGELCCSNTNPEVKFQNYAYDPKGNPTGIDQQTCNATEPKTTYVWDEENRLRFVDTNPSTPASDGAAIYTYDAGGDRIIKDVVEFSNVNVNTNNIGDLYQTSTDFNATLYPNGLMTMNLVSEGLQGHDFNGTFIKRVTKHYYAGSQRIASKIGESNFGGQFNCQWLIIPLGSGTPPINEKTTAQEKLDAATAASLEIMKANGITPPVNYGQNGGYSNSCASSFSGPQEKDAYWYHTDHLGSSSFVTGLDGEVNQNIEYFPSGEVFVENHRNSYNTPYKFNGKELDDETGYYYYGARYYNPRVSLWLNVDPLAEKYPSWSPYSYSFNNPINFIDPTGMEPMDIGDPTPKWYKNISLTYWKTFIKSAPNWTFNNYPFDARGYELLYYWTNGLKKVNGDLVYKNDKKWTNYMRANNNIANMLMDDAVGLANSMIQKKQTSLNNSKKDTFPFEIENGYLTGYEMLHGTQYFSITGVKGSYNKETDTYTFNYSLEWKDKIDTNAKQGDTPISDAVKSMPMTDPTDYNITIIWNQSVEVKGRTITTPKGNKIKTYDDTSTERGRNRRR